VRLTDEQRAAAFASERSIAVVAGAGTGKTRVLTSRYLDLVLDKRVEMSRILALTFTEKAAREMKERIREVLPHELKPGAEFAPISTIHGFLSRLLREHALDAGIDPRFTVADEMTAQLYLEDALADVTPELDLDTLVNVSEDERYLIEMYYAARATPLPLDDLAVVEPDLDALREQTCDFLDQLAELHATKKVTPKTEARMTALLALGAGLRGLDSEATTQAADLVGGNVSKSVTELFRMGRGMRDDWRGLGNLEALRAAGAAVRDALIRIEERYTEKKRAEGLVDFADLEHLGLALLRRIDVGVDYEHLLVDEYQDTSRIQEAILDRLAESCCRFAVGDAKQSIYRFRHADAAVFADLQHDAARYPLSGSFRSRPELVEFVNSMFGRLFPGSGVEPQDLHASAAFEEKAAPSIDLAVVDGDSEPEAHRREARALARRLRTIVEGDELAITRRDHAESGRPIRYRDCAILLRAMTHLHIYERALLDEGVPFVVVMGRGYYAAREVVELAYLLSLLDDPTDRYRAVGVMTSLLCGVPETDLLRLPDRGPLPLAVKSMARPDEIPEERWQRLLLFAGRFELWRSLAGRIETGDLVERILSETRFADLLLLEPDGRRRHANLQKALRRARLTAADPSTYARELLEFRERERRESEAPIAAETDEAVRIMTIHASKGLEFPLVAVADLAAPKRGRSGAILRHDGVFDLKLREGITPGRKALRDWDRAQEEYERLRLFYVAFTRAQEHLLLTAARYKQSHTDLLDLAADMPGIHRLEPAPLLERDARRRQGVAVRAALRRGADLPGELERDEAAARALLDRIEAVPRAEIESTPYVVAVADLVEYRRCPRKYRLGRMLGIEIEEIDEAEGREPVDSEEHPRRLQGTAFHNVMAEIGPGAVPDEAMVKRHLPDARAVDIGKIVGWAEWLGEQDMVRRIRNAKQEREMPFLARVAGLAVRGVIDLYVPELPLLLDYKTSAKVREGEYAIQVAVYLEALRALGHAAPDCAQLVYVDAKKVVEVPEQPLAALIEDFRAAHVGEGSFPPQPGEACTYCEFRKACLADGVACPGELTLF